MTKNESSYLVSVHNRPSIAVNAAADQALAATKLLELADLRCSIPARSS